MQNDDEELKEKINQGLAELGTKIKNMKDILELLFNNESELDTLLDCEHEMIIKNQNPYRIVTCNFCNRYEDYDKFNFYYCEKCSIFDLCEMCYKHEKNECLNDCIMCAKNKCNHNFISCGNFDYKQIMQEKYNINIDWNPLQICQKCKNKIPRQTFLENKDDYYFCKKCDIFICLECYSNKLKNNLQINSNMQIEL